MLIFKYENQILEWTMYERKLHNYTENIYSKTCVKRPLSKDPKMVFKTNYRLMQNNSIAECSPAARGALCNSFDLY